MATRKAEKARGESGVEVRKWKGEMAGGHPREDCQVVDIFFQ